MTSPAEPLLYKIPEAGRLVGCTGRTYLRWSEVGKVPKPIEIADGELRVVKSELDEWLDAKRRERDRKAKIEARGQALRARKSGHLPPGSPG